MDQIKHWGKMTLGTLLRTALPRRAGALAQDGFTLDMSGRLSRTDRLIRYAMIQEAIASNDTERLVQYHRDYWRDRGKEYFDFATRNDIFAGFLAPYFDRLVDGMTARLPTDVPFHTLCEIGPGGGEALVYAAERLPAVQRFVGLDLNGQQMIENRERFPAQKFDWVEGEADSWIRANAGPSWIFMSMNGVLEYFPQETLQALFTHMATACRPSYFISIEPVGTNHDIERDTDSQIYGPEYSYSHAYPHLLRQAGFHVWHSERIPVSEQNGLCIVGAESL